MQRPSLAVAAVLVPAAALAQNGPTKPVRFVASLPAGSTTDIVAGGRVQPACFGRPGNSQHRRGRHSQVDVRRLRQHLGVVQSAARHRHDAARRDGPRTAVARNEGALRQARRRRANHAARAGARVRMRRQHACQDCCGFVSPGRPVKDVPGRRGSENHPLPSTADSARPVQGWWGDCRFRLSQLEAACYGPAATAAGPRHS